MATQSFNPESMRYNATWKEVDPTLLGTVLPPPRTKNEANVGDSSNERWKEIKGPMTYELLQSPTPGLPQLSGSPNFLFA